MRFLADMGISQSTVNLLQKKSHDIVHVRDIGMSKSSDAEIIQKAITDKRIVLTFDLDFGDILATNRKALPSVIIFRTHNQTPRHVQHHLTQVLSECSTLLEKGAILIIQDKRYRIRELPI